MSHVREDLPARQVNITPLVHVVADWLQSGLKLKGMKIKLVGCCWSWGRGTGSPCSLHC